MSGTDFVLPSFDNTYGALLIGGVISSALWGVGCAQLYIYFESRVKTDVLWLKIFVSFDFALGTLHQIFYLQALYGYLITDIGDVLELEVFRMPVKETTLAAELVVFLIQLLLIYRAWMLSGRNKALTGILLILVLGQLAVAIMSFMQTYRLDSFLLSVKTVPTVRAACALEAGADSAIAIALVVLLRRRRNEFGRTQSVINRIIKYTISTGLITAFLALVAMMFSIMESSDFIFMAILEVLPKVYFSCMLTSLNLRRSLLSDIGETSYAGEINSQSFRNDLSTSSAINRVVDPEVEPNSLYRAETLRTLYRSQQNMAASGYYQYKNTDVSSLSRGFLSNNTLREGHAI